MRKTGRRRPWRLRKRVRILALDPWAWASPEGETRGHMDLFSYFSNIIPQEEPPPMSNADPLPYLATREEYQQQAQALFDALKSGGEDAAWRFKWEHPRFRGKSVTDVRDATLELADAQTVIAQEYGFQTWANLVEYTEAICQDGAVARFEEAVETVVAGDVDRLRSMLREHPELVHARSTRRHHATLLHYGAANGVEGERQKTPANAVEVAKLLLDHGAEVDALADMYDAKCTTMSMLVSSGHPAQAGLQAALAETLLDYGAALEGPGSNWQSALLTALAFGYLDTAETLARRGAPLDNLAAVAGLGRLEDAARLLPAADGPTRHAALALAAQHGHTDVVRLLLDAGEDPSRYNPDGFHSHSTPLHQAVWSDHLDVVQLLVERGARLDIQDTVYSGTPLDWANYGGRTAIAEYLRGQDAPTT
jgi:ankyrin repeat protein